MRKALVAAGLAIALGVPLAGVIHKERVLSGGRTVLLALAPVDPRSLLQGDYMALRYELASHVPADAPRDGRLVLADGEKGVARIVRVHAGEPLGAGEYLLGYRRRGHAVRLGAESFFFQEGTGGDLAGARYGELRADADGDSVLVGLRDADLRPLGHRR